VDALAKPLLGRDALQQLQQLPALRDAEPTQQIALGVAADAVDLGHHDLAVAGEVQGMDSTVAAAAPTLDQAAILEIIEEGDHTAGGHTELIGDGLLAPTRMLGHGSEHADVRRGDAKWCNLLGVPGGSMGTELGQQECWTQEGRPLFIHLSSIWFAESFCL
jgi:hypothetical protein